MTDYIPSQSIEAEQACLGSMMIDKIKDSDPSALAIGLAMVTPGDFIRPAHQAVCEALIVLHARNEPADEITLTEELRRVDKLVEVGGTEYLMALVSTAPTPANIEHYAQIVKRHALKREQEYYAIELKERLADPQADPAEVLEWANDKLQKMTALGRSGPRPIRELLMIHHVDLDARHKRGGKLIGYSSGITRLDELTGGFGDALFLVLKGASGSGKTHIMLQFARMCLQYGKGAIIYGLDGAVRILLNRFIARQSKLNSRRLLIPQDNDWDGIVAAEAVMYEWPCWIETYAGTTVGDIKAYSKAIAGSGVDIGLVAVDYAECVQVRASGLSREQELSAVAECMRAVADDLGTTALLLSQVNQAGEERYSRSLGNRADTKLAWRPHDTTNDTGCLIVEKNREGISGSIDCYYDWRTGVICDIRDAPVEEQEDYPRHPDATRLNLD